MVTVKLLAALSASMGILGVGMTLDETTVVPLGLVAASITITAGLAFKGAGAYFRAKATMAAHARRLRRIEKRLGISPEDEEGGDGPEKPDAA